MRNMKKCFCLFLTAVLLPALLIPAASAEKEEKSLSGKTKLTTDFFGTVSAMYVWDDFSDPTVERRFQAVWDEAKAMLTEIENAVSVSRENSDIARFNRLREGESVEISEHTAKLIRTAKTVYGKTGGLYDPSVFPLVDLWGFSPRFSGVEGASEKPLSQTYPPEDEYREAFAQLADFSGVELSGGDGETWTLTKRIPAVTVYGQQFDAQLDLGGIAKGYAADSVTALMAERGIKYGYFNCGGSSLSLMQGRPTDGDCFFLGVRKPRGEPGDNINYMTVPVANCALSTSGDYDHCRLVDGVRWCHIIDPNTGWPANTPAVEGRQRGIATATVIGPDAAYADCVSTALCLMQPADALAFVNRELRDCKVVFVLFESGEDTYEVITNMLPEDYSIDDTAYHVTSEVRDGETIYTGVRFADLF